MLNINKRKLLIIIISISILLFISTNFILLKHFYIQKKRNYSNLILKNTNIPPIKTIEIDEIVKSQYKSSNWRLIIEKINLDAPIIEGTTKEVLRRGIGHFESTTKWEGNICLAAHNRGYKYNYFQEIKKLENGDIITYKTQQGTKKYKVISNKVIKETDWSCVKETKENKITLITCEENKKEYRRCIQAREIY